MSVSKKITPGTRGMVCYNIFVSRSKNEVKKYSNNQNGFTLLELLIVMAIIAMLAGLMNVSYRIVREKARDTRRITDAKTIVNAIEMYKTSHNALPETTAGENDLGLNGYIDIGNVALGEGNTFIKDLVDAKVLTIPAEEKDGNFATGNSSASYRYIKYNGSGDRDVHDSNCDFEYSVLGVRLEHPISEYKITNSAEACFVSGVGADWATDPHWIVHTFRAQR